MCPHTQLNKQQLTTQLQYYAAEAEAGNVPLGVDQQYMLDFIQQALAQADKARAGRPPTAGSSSAECTDDDDDAEAADTAEEQGCEPSPAPLQQRLDAMRPAMSGAGDGTRTEAAAPAAPCSSGTTATAAGHQSCANESVPTAAGNINSKSTPTVDVQNNNSGCVPGKNAAGSSANGVIGVEGPSAAAVKNTSGLQPTSGRTTPARPPSAYCNYGPEHIQQLARQTLAAKQKGCRGPLEQQPQHLHNPAAATQQQGIGRQQQQQQVIGGQLQQPKQQQDIGRHQQQQQQCIPQPAVPLASPPPDQMVLTVSRELIEQAANRKQQYSSADLAVSLAGLL